MWFLVSIAFFSMLQTQYLNGCCRRFQQAYNSAWGACDSNPELPVLQRSQRILQNEQTRRINLQERRYLNDPAHYIGVGIVIGVTFTLIINKLLTEIKDC